MWPAPRLIYRSGLGLSNYTEIEITSYTNENDATDRGFIFFVYEWRNQMPEPGEVAEPNPRHEYAVNCECVPPTAA